VMDFYNAMLANRQQQEVVQAVREDGRIETISGTGEATVTEIALLDESGGPVDLVDVGSPVTLQVTVTVRSPLPRLVLGYMIKDRLGQVMYGTNTHLKELPLHDLPAGARVAYRFSFRANLGPGSYSVATALVSSETHLVNNYEWRDLALVFTVSNMSREYFAGSAWLDPSIEVVRT
jgi:lipopolysaccharide transport system ATP-binding protein